MRPGTVPRSAEAGAAMAALGATALWGGMYVVSKDTFDEIPPITLAALRLGVAGAALAIPMARRGDLGKLRDPGLLLAGLLLAATMITQFVGTGLATASEGALLTTTTPLFLVPLGWAFLKERPRATVVTGIVVGLAGVVVAIGAGATLSRSPWGPVFLLLSAAGWAGYTVASAPASRRDGALTAVTAATLVALPVVAALSVFEADRWRAAPFAHPVTLAAVAYLGLAASAGAWYLWNRGVASLPAAVAGAFFFVQPLVGGLLARLALGERLGVGFAGGGVLILLGVLLALRTPVPGPRRERSRRELRHR